jgi:acyl carrier protein
MKIKTTHEISIINEIKTIVSQVARINLVEIDDDVKIREELGIDSLMAIEIIAKIEKRFTIQINEKEVIKITTVGEFVEYIVLKITSA